jgi:arylsulfatase A
MLNKSITLGPRQLGFDSFQGISASLDMPPYMYIENDNFLQTGELKMQEREANTRPGPSASDFSRINVSNTIIQNAIHFLRSNMQQKIMDKKRSTHHRYFSLFLSHLPILLFYRHQNFKVRVHLAPMVIT